jgi:hypothetical protein
VHTLNNAVSQQVHVSIACLSRKVAWRNLCTECAQTDATPRTDQTTECVVSQSDTQPSPTTQQARTLCAPGSCSIRHTTITYNTTRSSAYTVRSWVLFYQIHNHHQQHNKKQHVHCVLLGLVLSDTQPSPTTQQEAGRTLCAPGSCSIRYTTITYNTTRSSTYTVCSWVLFYQIHNHHLQHNKKQNVHCALLSLVLSHEHLQDKIARRRFLAHGARVPVKRQPRGRASASG